MGEVVVESPVVLIVSLDCGLVLSITLTLVATVKSLLISEVSVLALWSCCSGRCRPSIRFSWSSVDGALSSVVLVDDSLEELEQSPRSISCGIDPIEIVSMCGDLYGSWSSEFRVDSSSSDEGQECDSGAKGGAVGSSVSMVEAETECAVPSLLGIVLGIDSAKDMIVPLGSLINSFSLPIRYSSPHPGLSLLSPLNCCSPTSMPCALSWNSLTALSRESSNSLNVFLTFSAALGVESSWG